MWGLLGAAGGHAGRQRVDRLRAEPPGAAAGARHPGDRQPHRVGQSERAHSRRPKCEDEISELARLLNQMFDRLGVLVQPDPPFHRGGLARAEDAAVAGAPAGGEAAGRRAISPRRRRRRCRCSSEELARLNRIIEELLFLSRAEARAITLELKPAGPLRLLQVFAQDARVLAEHHGQHFVLSREGEGIVAFEENACARYC